MARLVVIAPGRGSYNRSELSYLTRYADNPRAAARAQLAAEADGIRAKLGRATISEIDGAGSYSPKVHLPGENASSLIYTCAVVDLAVIHPAHEIVAALGNSMGWYIALHVGRALSFEQGFKLIETMGYFQKDNVLGGQIIYPVVDDEWRADPAREAAAMAAIEEVRGRGEDHWVGLSIRLGGLLVLAGTNPGIKALLETLPKLKMGPNEYPFQLARHSAFHTHIMRDASSRALYQLNGLIWNQPKIPIIDGRGFVWRPQRTDTADLQNYTLAHQVVEPFDFSASLRVAIREYNPDHLVLLGPGETMGGAIAQVMIAEGWRGIDSKSAFIAAQKSQTPPLISMNRPEQASLIV